MDANIVLMLYIIPLLFGTALITPFFPTLGTALGGRWPQYQIPRRQRLLGLNLVLLIGCLLYTSPSPRDGLLSRMPSSA